MKILKSSLLATAALSAIVAVIVLFNSQASTAQSNPPGREVKVINTRSEAVPVNVGNFPPFPTSVAASRQNWEYKIINARLARLDQILTQLNTSGNEGWEAVGVVAGNSMPDGSGGASVLLKRPR